MELEFIYPRNTLRAFRSSFNICPCIPDRIGIWQCWFLRRGENRSTRRKTSRSKERTNNKLNAQMTPGPGIELGPHWWEASALTTTPPLPPVFPWRTRWMKNHWWYFDRNPCIKSAGIHLKILKKSLVLLSNESKRCQHKVSSHSFCRSCHTALISLADWNPRGEANLLASRRKRDKLYNYRPLKNLGCSNGISQPMSSEIALQCSANWAMMHDYKSTHWY